MPEPVDIAAYRKRTESQAQHLDRLVSGGGGPHDPGMEPRVAVLEQIAKETREALIAVKGDLVGIRADISAMRSEVGWLKGRVEQLPSTWVLVTTIVTAMATLLGSVIAIMRLLGSG